MKGTTGNSLVVAKSLIEQAASLCGSDDRHLASAGLVILQDALEMVFYALLIELGVDEGKNIENKSFDELIGELKKAGIVVPKSGTLKALNKQRVLTKHYAQLAEPATVRGYFDAARDALGSIVASVTGKPLSEIYMADLIEPGETQGLLKEAETLVESGQHLEALTAIRKAIFIEFEVDYSIYGCRDYEVGSSGLGLGLGGWKSPYWTRNKEWITENVRDPLDYIQIDHDQWRLDAAEWGVSTAELQNIRNLTPAVFRGDGRSDWSVKYDAAHLSGEISPEAVKYCLDRSIAVILKKREHWRAGKYSRTHRRVDLPEGYLGASLHASASLESRVVHIVSNEFQYKVIEVVSGFDSSQQFFRLFGASVETDERGTPVDFIAGYLHIRDDA